MWRDSASVDTYLMQCFSKYTSCSNTRKKHSSAATFFLFFSPSFFPLCLFFLFLTSVSIVFDETTENHKQRPQRIHGWVPTNSQICVENLGLVLSLQHLTAVCDLVMCRVTTYKEEEGIHKHSQVRAWRGLIESVHIRYIFRILLPFLFHSWKVNNLEIWLLYLKAAGSLLSIYKTSTSVQISNWKTVFLHRLERLNWFLPHDGK